MATTAGERLSDPKNLLVVPDGIKAEAFNSEGDGYYGHLEARPDGVVVFVKDDQRPIGG